MLRASPALASLSLLHASAFHKKVIENKKLNLNMCKRVRGWNSNQGENASCLGAAFDPPKLNPADLLNDLRNVSTVIVHFFTSW
jgi:hypothetical protein